MSSHRSGLATRNLTTLFQRARSAFLAKRGPSATGADYGSTAAGYDMRPLDEGGAGAASASLPPVYVDRVDELNTLIEQIREKMRDLNTSHAERIRNVMEEEGGELESRIEVMTADITHQFSTAGAKLKSMSLGSSGSRTTEDAIRLNIQRSMARKLFTLSSEFKKSQKRYFTQMKEQKAAASGDLGVITGSKRDPIPEDTGFGDDLRAEMEEFVDYSEERDAEIESIARSINELAEIFKELNVLVVEQGTLLDRIDHNIDLTSSRVQKGVESLKQAEAYQKSARPFYVITCLTITIVALIVFIILKKL